MKFEVEIGGKKRTLNFGMLCWEIYCKKMQVSPNEMISVFQTSKSFRAIRTLVYAALRSQQFLEGSIKEITENALDGSPEEITERDVANWLNDDFDAIGQIFAKVMETITGGQQTKAIAKSRKPKK